MAPPKSLTLLPLATGLIMFAFSLWLYSNLFMQSDLRVSNDDACTNTISDFELAEKKYQSYVKDRERVRRKIDCTGKVPHRLVCGTYQFHMAYLAPLYPCFRENHLGAWGEGGKWLCDVPGAIPQKTGIVYSIGSHANYGFEKSIFEAYKIKTYTFDPTLTEVEIKKMKSLGYVKFNEFGLTGEDDLQEQLETLNKSITVSSNAKMMKLKDVMKFLKHSYVDILKIDCEGCEESLILDLPNFVSRKKPRFGQMLLEFHRLDNLSVSLPLLETIESLGYREFHAEPNVYHKEQNWELAYIHESLVLQKK